MKYCEHCHSLSDGNTCSLCGSENLREVGKRDFCFVSEMEEIPAKMFVEMLKRENIPFVSVPVSGKGLSLFACFLEERYKIYVPYELFEKAKELVENFSVEE